MEKCENSGIKDLYMIPLLDPQDIPQELRELTDDAATIALKTFASFSIMIGIIVRHKSKARLVARSCVECVYSRWTRLKVIKHSIYFYHFN